ncbi:MAG: Crp/Fnr family transcriptional regulator [Erythrobacter sp.]|jgi:CRP/FNR family transcriptional regulator
MDAQRCNLMRDCGWSGSLPHDVQTELIASVQTERVPKGQEAISQGEPFAGLVCVLEGEMKVVGTARRGDELLIGILRPGDWTGFLSALDRRGYAFSARAVKDCRVARLAAAATRRIFERDVDRFRLLLRPELSVSRKNYSYFIETSYRAPLQRLGERMMGLGRWPYSIGEGEVTDLEELSQADLANATRLSRQTINACLQTLAAHGLVRLGYKSVEVLDLERLGQVARGDLVLE